MLVAPFVGAVLQALLPAGTGARTFGRSTARLVALGASLISSLAGAALVFSMQTHTADLQMIESHPWIGAYSIQYAMGMDGLNAPLVLLLSILFPILIAAEWDRPRGERGVHGLFLILQAALVGAVCAQDIFLQFFFWTLSALPFYFLVGVWGGKRRESAAFRLVVTSAIGNALLLAALILIYHSIEPHSFLIQDLAGGKLVGKTFDFLGYTLSVPSVAFILIGAGLALRIPIWPVHGWFTLVSEEAPMTVVVALSAITVPVGAYIFQRLGYSLFPATFLHFAPAIVVVGAVNLVIGTICAIAQRDLRTLLAYICLVQLGLVLVGMGSLSSPGTVGAIYLQLVMGLGIAGFGIFANSILQRTGMSWFFDEEGKRTLGGVALQAPALATVAALAVASLLGVPGFGGFVGSTLVVIGSYSVSPGMVVLACVATLLSGYYLFTMYRNVFLGEASSELSSAKFQDLTFGERAYLLPLVGCLLFFGLYPKPLIELVRPTVLTLLSTIK
ncbi:MAG: NADH-quinone oxidoreductase subunit M [Oligoflexia bacterium]|nr:NADH-quinone oxidoreductase subunit M [Oligoflexia bacterium]